MKIYDLLNKYQQIQEILQNLPETSSISLKLHKADGTLDYRLTEPEDKIALQNEFEKYAINIKEELASQVANL